MTIETQVDTADLSAPTESEVVKPTELDTKTETAAVDVVEEKQAEPVKPFKPIESQEEYEAGLKKRLEKQERSLRRQFEQQVREYQQQAPKTAQGDSEVNQRPTVSQEDVKAYLDSQKASQARETFIEKAEDATERYPDYFSVVTDPRVPFSDEMVELFAESKVGVDLAYFLGKNPQKVIEMLQMQPLKAGRELARLENELEAKQKPAVKTSTAPAPIVPVGSKGRTSPNLATADFADYKKQREAGGAKWKR